MGNDNSSFYKCYDQDRVPHVNFLKDQVSTTTITSYNKSRSKTTYKSNNKNCVILNEISININYTDTISNEETTKRLVRVKKEVSARKIVKFFRLIKIKNSIKTSNLLSTNNINSNPGKTNYNTQHSKINCLSDYWNGFCSYLGQKSRLKHKLGFGIWKCFQDKSKLSAEYIGNFSENKANGIGKVRFICNNDSQSLSSLQTFVGEFKNNKTNGFGIYIHTNGGKYIGRWNNDLPDDIGTELWPDNSCYQGEFKNGKKNGVGVYKWPDNSFYEGEWKDNNINGFGAYHYPDGKRKYIGEWSNNLKHGQGEYISKDKKYIGMFKNDKKHGFGIMYWLNHNKALISFWSEGKQLGIGKCWTKDKIKYGIWKESKSKSVWFNVNWINEIEVNICWKSWNTEKWYNIFSLSWDDVKVFFNKNDVLKAFESP